MAAIRSELQRQLFQPDDERLVAVVNVVKGKADKRKKVNKKQQQQQQQQQDGASFLCLAVSGHQPVHPLLYRVKVDQKGEVYRKKECWNLRNITLVDGINPRKPNPDLQLTIDGKIYYWSATNITEKDPFIRQLWKLSNRHLAVQKPEFVNVPIPVEELELAAESAHQIQLTVLRGEGDSEGGADDVLTDYQPISVKEDTDFRRLLAGCNMTVGQAEAFADQLTKQLSLMDGANIQAIMGSERSVGELMNLIDSALEEADRLESELDSFDQLLANVRDNVEMMEEKDSLSRVETNNRMQLMEELRQFVASMELSDEHRQVLEQARLSDPSSINRCTRAAVELQRSLQAKIPAGLDRMDAYKEQFDRCQRLSDTFAEKLIAHLSALFQTLLDLREEPSGQWHELSMPKHSQRHHALMPFSELIMWLKISKPVAYKGAIDRYIDYTKELYKRDMDLFFERLRVTIEKLPSGGTLRRESGGIAGKLGFSDTEKIGERIEAMLSEVEPVVSSEQKFCVRFFHLSSELAAVAETQLTGSGDQPLRSVEKQQNESVRKIVGQLFKPLESVDDGLLMRFINQCQEANPFSVMNALVSMHKKVISVRESGSYISYILGTLVVLVKRKFDQLMEREVVTLADFRLPKKIRVGLLPTLSRFMYISSIAESVFRDTERRTDLDRWYPQLVNAVCQGIERTALDPNSKSPPAVVKLENYHQLYSDISELKVACLESQRKNVKKLYQDNMAAYVKEYMGKPLDRLQQFFDQAERCIAQGMKPEEVGYQQQFNKQELKRIIASYPAKEVKKGLDLLYKKVEKHLADDSPLLQVVWRDMQDEFLRQFKLYCQLISQCYPNSKIELEFTIEDVLHFFSEIAQQH